MLRYAGDARSIGLAVPEVMRSGSIPAILNCATEIDLDNAARTNLPSEIEFVKQAAEVLPPQQAVKHTRWALEVLKDPSTLRDRLKPSFFVVDALLDMIANLITALPEEATREVIEHIVALPPIEDQSVAHEYAKIVYRMPDGAWSSADIAAIRSRIGDNFELREEFDTVVAAADEAHRMSLQGSIANGDWAALEAFGDVRDLDRITVEPLVEKLSAAVQTDIARIRSGQSGRGGRQPAATLVIVNVWHPDCANWQSIIDLLSTGNGFTYHLKRPLQYLYRLGSSVPRDVADEMEPGLRHLMTAAPRARPLTGDPDVRGDAAAALESLLPGAVTQPELWGLTLGSPEQRVGAAQVLAAGRRVEKLDALAAIAHDDDARVRGAVANLLVGWLRDEPEHDSASLLLRQLLETGGMSSARSVAARLDGTPRCEALDQIASLLRDHGSGHIRKRVDAYFSGRQMDE